MINIKTDYGAVGDGITDDTAAIQAAIDAAAMYFGEGTDLIAEVYAPAGVYNITDTIEVYGLRGLTFRGAGARQTVFRNTTNSNGLMIIGQLSTDSNLIDGYVGHFSLEGNGYDGGANTTEFGLYVTGDKDDDIDRPSKGNTFENIYIRYCGGGPGIVNNAFVNTFNQCQIWQCGEGVNIGQTNNCVNFNQLYLTGCTGCAVRTYGGVESTANSFGIHFRGSVIQNCGVSAGRKGMIDIQGGHHWTFNECFFEAGTASPGTPEAIIYVDNKIVSFENCTYNVNNDDWQNLPLIKFLNAGKCKVENFRVYSGGSEITDSLVQAEGTSSVLVIRSGGGTYTTSTIVDNTVDGTVSQMFNGGGSVGRSIIMRGALATFKTISVGHSAISRFEEVSFNPTFAFMETGLAYNYQIGHTQIINGWARTLIEVDVSSFNNTSDSSNFTLTGFPTLAENGRGTVTLNKDASTLLNPAASDQIEAAFANERMDRIHLVDGANTRWKYNSNNANSAKIFKTSGKIVLTAEYLVAN